LIKGLIVLIKGGLGNIIFYFFHLMEKGNPIGLRKKDQTQIRLNVLSFACTKERTKKSAGKSKCSAAFAGPTHMESLLI
jgi:hypothetical protein